MISPKLVEVGRHLNINLITNSEIKTVAGEPGNFTVTLANHPRYIDPVKCTGCGECAGHCPVSAVNAYNKGLDQRRAAYIEYAQAVPLAFAIDMETCIGCGLCENMCLADAINYGDNEKESDLTVGSIILSAGSEGFDPSGLDYLGYDKYTNVVTSEEFERILSASGPYFGHLMRPLDREEPGRIAWLQCVGSRDNNRCGNTYCSSVCCMYAVKEAMIAKEHAHGDLDCVVFNMDMRTFGKDYEKYYDRARNEEGVKFVKARIHSVTEMPESGDLAIRFVDESGDIKEEIFSMLVLSVGLKITQSSVDLAKNLGIDLNRHNFVQTEPFAPVATSRPGIYTCGVFQGPKDIPGSITEASAAAAAATSKLAEARGSDSIKIEVPEEIDVLGETPRIGVFVCNCGINIGGIVDVDAVQEHAATLPFVVFTDQNLFTCSQDTQDKIKEKIKEHKLNRVVVASCSPKTHEQMFMETLEACGLNKYLFEMANIRNQDSWIHSKMPTAATGKAKDLVQMAVARAATLYPLNEKRIPVIPRAVVIGGGIAGMNAALSLADQNFEIVLVEKEARLGGFANRLFHTIEGADVQAYVADLAARIEEHPGIQVLTRSLIVGFSGFKGNFTTEVLVGPGMYERKIEHGAIIIATGAVEYQPEEFLYEKDARVKTQVELTEILEQQGAKGLEQVVMIQCVGSRNKENPNCSRICCQSAVKNALAIKEKNPDAQIYILYRDIRTYGLLEDYYTEARRRGVLFFRYDPEDPPSVESAKEGVQVTFFDYILGRKLRVRADLLVLSAGMRAEDTEELASILKLARNVDGYFMEAHVKLRPVDMATEGVFVCGTAHGPKLISETVAQAQAAASRATTFLSSPYLTLSAVTARVDTDKCAACLVCVRSCSYDVPRINADGVSEIDEALCHGCGACVAECPAKAIELNWYEDIQILSKVDALLEGVL
ncbi:MAG: heterodisulfide reductase [Desulfobacteraceae bacterium 4572_123]|nr:MAG: heterodisulfide reductase [Desulfobacteraceae bacterium 4572_123]